MIYFPKPPQDVNDPIRFLLVAWEYNAKCGQLAAIVETSRSLIIFENKLMDRP